jgi:co-chaperonin GroES (HSP10)
MNKFKKHWIEKGLGDNIVNISDAGDIPESLLARQDLENENNKQSTKSTFMVGDIVCLSPGVDGKVIGINGSKYVVMTTIGTEETIDQEWIDAGNVTLKGAVEQTGKDLDKLKEKAADADTEGEKDSIAGRIKSAQEKRQKATIVAREKESTEKSFKNFWKNSIEKGKGMEDCAECKGSGKMEKAKCTHCDGAGVVTN